MALLVWPSEIGTMLKTELSTRLVPYGFDSDAVYYGDVDPVKFPTVTLEVADNKIDVKNLARAEREFAVYLMVYYGRYSPQESARLAADQLAEDVCAVLNQDFQWKDSGGNQRVIRGWTTRLQPGYAIRQNSRLYAARITWEALSQAPLH